MLPRDVVHIFPITRIRVAAQTAAINQRSIGAVSLSATLYSISSSQISSGGLCCLLR